MRGRDREKEGRGGRWGKERELGEKGCSSGGGTRRALRYSQTLRDPEGQLGECGGDP